jgi:formylglycine-generating enzyme required for sulfatase activity
MGDTPRRLPRGGGGKGKVADVPDADLKQFPVENISWDMAMTFIARLNEMDKVHGTLYRLPAEAEWEYACRGGVTLTEDCSFDYYFQHPTNDLTSREANFDGNFPAGNDGKGLSRQSPCKVGSFAPNRLGLYDMHGNVWEWCNDLYEGGPDRVFRGGGWDGRARDCRAANRDRNAPVLRSYYLGFRVARSPSGGK